MVDWGSLLSEAGAVVSALESGQMERARRSLSTIVGRDTDNLIHHEIARAVIETVAENLCGGVVAPLFYLSLGRVPLAMAYKALNTLDSTIGHPEHPYTFFGRFAARCDDLANLVPARLTALAISRPHGSTQNRTEAPGTPGLATGTSILVPMPVRVKRRWLAHCESNSAERTTTMASHPPSSCSAMAMRLPRWWMQDAV